MSTKVNIVTKNLDTEYRVEKALLAAHCLEQLINSFEFMEGILTMPESWRKGSTGEFKDMSNVELYETIMRGVEEWNGEDDYEIDMVIDEGSYSRWSRVIGHMIPMKPTTWVNPKFFDSNDIKKVVSNFLHEYFHHLGMRHGGDYFRSSIPYYANFLVEKIFDKVCDLETPTYKKVCRGWWIFRRCRYVKVNS